jgi:glycosyltransferase involved in cell wall biosynthesis
MLTPKQADVADRECVSIIIPCFNSEKWIQKAIESCLSQTHTLREIIAIDDGSTDSTLEVLKSFGDVIRWETGPNRGGCHARNRGISISNGDWIQFLDADDYLHPTKLEKQLAIAINERNIITYCDYRVLTENGEETTRSCATNWSDPFIFVLEHTELTTIGPLHRKKWLESVGGFRPGLRAAQEFDLHLRLAAQGFGFKHLPEPLFTVRRQQTSVSSNPTRTLEQWMHFIPEIIDLLRKNGKLDPNRRNALARRLATSARLILRYGDPKIGMQLLTLATELDHTSASLAYGKPLRLLRNILGPYFTEKLSTYAKLIVGPTPPNRNT